MPGISILPLHELRPFVVMPNISQELPLQILLGCEDTAGDYLPFNLGEPQIHLVEPGGVRGREMQANRRMVAQEGLHQLGLVRGEIVEDYVQRLPARLMGHEFGQERDEFGRGMPLRGAAEHRAAARVKRGAERQRPVSGIFKTVPFRPSGRERQHGIQPIQRLDRGLLIDTEDGCMLGRIQIQPNDIRRLTLKVRIVRRHVPFEAMGLGLNGGRIPFIRAASG